MSTLFKQIYRYTRPRTYRHNENIWPFCRISRASTGDINRLHYKRQLVPLISLTDWYHRFEDDVLVVATGPSINKINFAKLPKICVIGVNGAYFLRKQINFQLYVIVDVSFVDKQINVIKNIISDPNLTLFTTIHVILYIIKYFTLKAISCQLALIEDACYRIYQPRISRNNIKRYFWGSQHIQFSSDDPCIAFTTDIRKGIFDAGTVVFWTLQILFYLGFKRIYIVGLDMNNFDQPRFYEKDYNKLPSFLANKFKSLIVPAFALASNVFKKNGVEVKNLLLSSALNEDIFEKVSFSSIFKY